MYLHVIEILSSCTVIEKIIVDTTCPEMLDLPKNTNVEIMKRSPSVSSDEMTMNVLLDDILSRVEGDHFLQTHVTNPLLNASTIEDAVATYFDHLDTHDSLLSVDKIYKRAFLHSGKPINHRFNQLKPTQELEPIMVENSNLFIFSRKSFRKSGESRVGLRPYFYEMKFPESLDIDTPEDYDLARKFFEIS